jgi:hypothetical protein
MSDNKGSVKVVLHDPTKVVGGVEMKENTLKIGLVMKVNGTPKLKKWNGKTITAKVGIPVHQGDHISLGKEDFCTVIYLDDKSVVKIRPNTDFQFVSKSNTRSLIMKQGYGSLPHVIFHEMIDESGKPRTYRVETPVSVAAVKG